jgi:hypothetical protein
MQHRHSTFDQGFDNFSIQIVEAGICPVNAVEQAKIENKWWTFSPFLNMFVFVLFVSR